MRRLALAAAATILTMAADMIVPEQTGAVAQAAQAKNSARAKKRVRVRGVRPYLRPAGTFSGVVAPRQELVMPNPNFPPYNSGTVAPNVAPARDPIVPGIGPVPQLPPLARPETFSDRAVRCSHQAAAFNVPAEQRGVYQNRCASGR